MTQPPPAVMTVKNVEIATKWLRDKTITTDEAAEIRKAIEALSRAVEEAHRAD